MEKTISVHNGSAVSRAHNKRIEKVTSKQEHIDPKLSHRNEYLIDEDPRMAYRRIFGEALGEYNEKQTRNDRKIDDYYKHVQKDVKKHPVYELIVQVGDRNDTGIESEVERNILKDYTEKWSERNPNLELIGAYLHADEPDGTIHMHLDYVPVAHGYKRGMKVQNGLVKALGEQGFKVASGKGTAQQQWQDNERRALKELCLERNIEVAPLKGEKRKHLDTDIYKQQQRLKEAQAEVKDIEADLSVFKQAMDKTLAKSNEFDIAGKKGVLGKRIFTEEAFVRIKELVLGSIQVGDENNSLKKEIIDLQRERSDVARGYNQELDKRIKLEKEVVKLNDVVIKQKQRIDNQKGFLNFIRNKSTKNLKLMEKYLEEFKGQIADHEQHKDQEQEIVKRQGKTKAIENEGPEL